MKQKSTIMNKKIKAVQQMFDTIEKQNWLELHTLLADYFMLSGSGTPAMTKEDFIITMRELCKGFPDLKFNVRNLILDEGLVSGIMQITGTHLGEFSLYNLGETYIQPTNKLFELPAESFEVWVEDGEISDLIILQHPEGGLKGLLKKIKSEQKQTIAIEKQLVKVRK
jgi:predicted ester cyclase